jgi:hypothetical protein
VLHRVRPLLRIGGPGNQFQVPDELPNRAAELVAEDEAGERAALSLPILRERFEANVLGEDDAAKLVGLLQQIAVIAFGPAILNGGQYVHAATPQLIRDRLRYVHVHVERHGQLEQTSSLQAQEER